MKGSMEYMSENKRYEYWKDSDTAYDTKIHYGQYFRIIDKKEMVCLLNEQEAEIKRLEDELQNLQTFKKVLEFAEKDMEERADWQAYCEKEFEGL